MKLKKMLALTMAGLLAAGLTACGSTADTADTSGAPDGDGDPTTLTVAMECAYAPYNWTQSDDSNGAVAIRGSSDYAYGYDVMMAKKIGEALGQKVQIVKLDWDSLIPAVMTGDVDCVIAGQSMTEDRMAEVDMAGPYFYASIVCVTKEGSDVASATGISQLTGTCTAQTGTIWYDTCLPQAAEVADIEIMPQTEDAPAMIMAVESGTVNFICTDIPTAMGACARYDDLTILDFSDNAEDNFDVSEGDINIGISVVKGNTQLKDAIDTVLAPLNGDIFNAIMNEAIAVQPTI